MSHMVLGVHNTHFLRNLINMAELALCEIKSKRAKKKKRANLPELNSISEENSSSPEAQEAGDEAVDIFFLDVMTEAVKLSLTSSFESLSKEQHEGSNFNEPEIVDDLDEIWVPPELLPDIDETEADEFKFERQSYLEPPTIVSDDSVMLMATDKMEDNDELMMHSTLKHEKGMNDENNISQLRLVNSRTSLKQENEPSQENVAEKISDDMLGNLFKEEEQHSAVLKPSVFVGKGKLYSSSLQIGCHWDRTKYNIVLLPDLSKVVYPDLDSLLFNKPSTDPFSLHGNIPRHDDNLLVSSKAVDRSSKPTKTITITTSKTENNEMNLLINEPLPRNSVETLNGTVDIPNIESEEDATSQFSGFTDYNIDGIDFRVFMSPVKWSPEDNYQLVLFRVGPIYYEEFFTKCATNDGLIRAVKGRADRLSKHQLSLAQTCLVTEFSNSKIFRLPNATLVIYGCPSKFDWMEKSQIVRFGVDEAFYEENFQGCKSFEDIIKAVKHRAEIICTQQKVLKAKAYSRNETAAEQKYKPFNEEEFYDLKLDIIDNYCSLDDDKEVKHSESQKAILGSLDNDEDEQAKTIGDNSDPRSKDNGIKRTFKSFRKWLKGTFSKKTGKARSAPPNEHCAGGGTGSKDIDWQWNDSPEARSSEFLDDAGSENAKE